MRKSIISPVRTAVTVAEPGWLDLDRHAKVEVTSEAAGYPVEEALVPAGRGWRASSTGTQTIRLVFDQPQTVHLVRLVFQEQEISRTQEFVLRWLPQGTTSWKDIVRQQWNFSPPNTVEECEDYQLELSAAAALELVITPDISRGEARASLQSWRLAVRS